MGVDESVKPIGKQSAYKEQRSTCCVELVVEHIGRAIMRVEAKCRPRICAL